MSIAEVSRKALCGRASARDSDRAESLTANNQPQFRQDFGIDPPPEVNDSDLDNWTRATSSATKVMSDVAWRKQVRTDELRSGRFLLRTHHRPAISPQATQLAARRATLRLDPVHPRRIYESLLRVAEAS